jgi:hypothetical protein
LDSLGDDDVDDEEDDATGVGEFDDAVLARLTGEEFLEGDGCLAGEPPRDRDLGFSDATLASDDFVRGKSRVARWELDEVVGKGALIFFETVRLLAIGRKAITLVNLSDLTSTFTSIESPRSLRNRIGGYALSFASEKVNASRPANCASTKYVLIIIVKMWKLLKKKTPRFL